MKISFITTILNEEKHIKQFIDSLLNQSKLPDEIIIVDGGSSDGTIAKIQNLKLKMQNYSSKFKVIKKRGNRSIGRNEAIRQASGDIIVCSDAGCVLDKKWVENITKPFNDNSVDVVAGYYEGKPGSIFEKCLIPYVLVMPDRVNSDNFLPATRSMAFRKEIWRKIGGFDERFSHNEDYVFARRLKEAKAKIFFQKDAIVYWIPRKTINETFIMFFRFALGDAEARICRQKVIFLFCRYVVGAILLLYYFLTYSLFPLGAIAILVFVYLGWSISKNYRYVKNWRAVIILPILQVIADFAVLGGTTIGLVKSFLR